MGDANFNPVTEVDLTVGLSSFPHFYNVKQRFNQSFLPRNDGSCDESTPTSFGCLEQKYKVLKELSPIAAENYADNEVQRLVLSSSSGEGWSISPPNLEYLKSQLGLVSSRMYFQTSFQVSEVCCVAIV